jgi:hypothetical protein
MNISRRMVISLLFVTIIFFAGMLFWPFILNDIIKPIALVTWLLLRIFVLSIDQKYYWAAIIFVVAVFIYRLLPQDESAISSGEFGDSNETINTIEYWRSVFTLTDGSAHDDKTLKRGLVDLLTTLYASKEHTLSHFEIYEALQKGEISLPENIHKFLFLEEPKESGNAITKFFQSIRKTPRKWLRRWTGQEAAEHYRLIDEVLCFMETSLEMKNNER